ncbi:unnamed protein product, partial [Sphenostylis stenocarpa]
TEVGVVGDKSDVKKHDIGVDREVHSFPLRKRVFDPRRKVRNCSELEQLLQRITEIRGYTKFGHSKGRNSKSKTKQSEKLKVERNPNLREKEKSKGKSCGT